ncbi:MAG: 3-hydroxyacyl-CoA dehydrogenase NAD-binding domain-containing protein [Planctomycetales bacterium]
MAFQRIAVIGAGTMGRGIAETAAVRGLQVDVVEINPAQQEIAKKQMATSVEKGIQRGKISVKSADEVLGRIRWQSELSSVSEAEYVIEAVSENQELKSKVLKQLDEFAQPGVILASNTSSISITRLAAAIKRPELFVGMHFFNPVPIMQPVEIVRGLRTSEETIAKTRELAIQMGKEALVVIDSPGFVVNRVLMPLINEAVFSLQEGVGDAATIDKLVKLGCNHPMGPLELADLVGLDVCLDILRVMHKELGDPKFRPSPLLVRMVDGGKLGRKSGEGFYVYAR